MASFSQDGLKKWKYKLLKWVTEYTWAAVHIPGWTAQAKCVCESTDDTNIAEHFGTQVLFFRMVAKKVNLELRNVGRVYAKAQRLVQFLENSWRVNVSLKNINGR